jgi:hypothetical protein
MPERRDRIDRAVAELDDLDARVGEAVREEARLRRD